MPHFNPTSLPDLSGKVYIVTGGNAGIGYETIVHLVRHNAKVYMGCRSPQKGSAAVQAIQKLVPGADVQLLILDHMNLASIVAGTKDFTSKETTLNGLVNNAGIMAVPFETSKDGYESQWQTNYLSHALLTHLLLPTLLSTARASKPGDVRVVDVSSVGHNKFAPKTGIDFEDINQVKGGVWSRYGQSKLGNVLHAKELNRLYGPEGIQKGEGEIWTAALHPGNMYTDLSKNATSGGRLNLVPVVMPLMNALGVFIPVEQGAYTSVFCVASQEMKTGMSGEYFVPLGKVSKPSKKAQDSALATKLWAWTEKEFQEKRLI